MHVMSDIIVIFTTHAADKPTLDKYATQNNLELRIITQNPTGKGRL